MTFAPSEADSIPPFVANSPVMSAFCAHPDEDKAPLTHEGERKPAEHAWQERNRTYARARGLRGACWIGIRKRGGRSDGGERSAPEFDPGCCSARHGSANRKEAAESFPKGMIRET
ncbi:DUF417 family protein [Methylobacterium sp. CB376]|nr:DUF417 family protein [Methylobacterium nodulans]WFT83613.1 DUF417 family protein [Methylobacterium nodulans]